MNDYQHVAILSGADTGFVVRGGGVDKIIEAGGLGAQGAKPPEAPGFSCILKVKPGSK